MTPPTFDQLNKFIKKTLATIPLEEIDKDLPTPSTALHLRHLIKPKKALPKQK